MVTGRTVHLIGRRAAVLRTVGLDIAGPLVAYRLAVSLGIPQVWALVISGVPPAVGVLVDWVRWRTLEVVGAVVLATIGLSVAVALATGSAKAVLLDGAATTAAFGLLCLVSLSRRRPLIFYFGQAFYGGPHTVDGAEMDTDYETYAEARSFWHTVTTVWGVVYLVEAVARAALVQVMGTSTTLAVNRTVPWLLFGALTAWTVTWGNRLSAEKPVAAPEAEAPDRAGADETRFDNKPG